MFLSIFLRIVEVSNVSKIEGMDFLCRSNNYTKNTILAIVNMYQIYLTVKKKTRNTKKIS